MDTMTIADEVRKVMAEYEREARKLKSTDDFFTVLWPKLLEHVLQPMQQIDIRKLAAFADFLYAAATAYIEIGNDLLFQRMSAKQLRALNTRYERAHTHVRSSLRELSRAEQILKLQMQAGLKRGFLDCRHPMLYLKKLDKRLALLESTGLAVIHPGLWTDREHRLSRKRKLPQLHHPKYPATKGSAALQTEFVDVLEKQVQEFGGGKVRSGQIDKFISAFFAAVGFTITEEHVKTMRQRLKEARQIGSRELRYRDGIGV